MPQRRRGGGQKVDVPHKLVAVAPGVFELVKDKEKIERARRTRTERASHTHQHTRGRVQGQVLTTDGEKEKVRRLPFSHKIRANPRSTTIRRLQRDLKEVLAHPLPFVAALPRDNNWFRWYANLTAPEGHKLHGVYIHLHINIPLNYPKKAPKVELKTYLAHPNVYSEWICLDMLEDSWIPHHRSESKADLYTGWTSAYTIRSILLQLQSFLCENVQLYQHQLEKTTKSAKQLKCTCGHTNKHPFPMLSGLSARAQLIAIAQERKKAAAAARAAAARASCDAAAAAAVMAESPARRDSMASESGESRAGSETACGDECKGNDPVEAGHVESGPSSAGTPVAAASATTAAHTQASDVVGAPGQVASPAHGAAVTVTVKDIAPGYGVMFSVPSFPHLTARLCRAEVARQEYRNGRCMVFEDAGLVVGQNTTAFVCGRAAANLVPRHSRHRSFPSSVTSPALLVVSLVKPDPMSVFDEGSGDNQTGVAPTPPHPCHTVLDVCCDGVWVTSVDKALGWIPGTQLSRAIPQFGSAMDLDSVCSPGETLPPVFCPRPGNRYDGFSILRHCDGACHRDAQPPAANVRSRQLTRPPRRRRVNKGDKVAGTVFRIIRSGVLVQLDTGEKGLVYTRDVRRACGAHFWELEDVVHEGDALTVHVADVEMVPFSSRGRFEHKFAPRGARLRRQIRLELLTDPTAPSAELNTTGRGAGAVSGGVEPAGAAGAAGERPEADDDCAVMYAGATTPEALRRTRHELVCFHTKASYSEEVLGVGVNLEHYDGQRDNPDKLAYVHTTLDLIGETAVGHLKVRKNVWKLPFTHWIPLYLDPTHGETSRFRDLLKASLGSICGSRERGQAHVEFSPDMALTLFLKMMNTLVVSMMKGHLHESIVALDGYAACVHILLAMMRWYPSLRTIVDDRIARFLVGERGRNKYQCRSLGEWLPLLVLTDKYEWKDVANDYLEENFDRNAKWVLKEHPHLLGVADRYRQQARTKRAAGKDDKAKRPVRRQLMSIWSRDTRVSQHLLMFHVAFLRIFRLYGPTGERRASLRQLTTAELFEQLNACFGRPSAGMQMMLQRSVKAIRRVDDWDVMFHRVGLTPPSKQYLTQWLVQSIHNSERRRYHYRRDVEGLFERQEAEKQQRMRQERSRGPRHVAVDEWDAMAEKCWSRGRASSNWY